MKQSEYLAHAARERSRKRVRIMARVSDKPVTYTRHTPHVPTVTREAHAAHVPAIDQSSFAQAASAMHTQAANRDVLAARCTVTLCHVPTSDYVARQADRAREAHAARVASEAHAAMVKRNVRALRARHKANVTIRVSGIQGYWGDHLLVAAQALIGLPDTQAYADVWNGQASPRIASQALTARARDIISFIRNSEARKALVASGKGLPDNPEDRSDRAGVKVKRGHSVDGIRQSREARVSTRGAYGKRGIKGTFSQVSSRDNNVPYAHVSVALRNMPTVGIASHLGWLGIDPDAMLEKVRRDTRLCTVRIYPQGMSGPTHVALVRDYDNVAREREAAREAAREARARVTREAVVTRQASDITRQAQMGTLHSDAA